MPNAPQTHPSYDGRSRPILLAILSFSLWFAAAAHAQDEDTADAGSSPGRKLICQREGIFTLIGNIPPDEMQAIREHTIRACSEALFHDFFDKRPTGPIKIYLFKDDANYRAYAKKLFNETPSSPYGYYMHHGNRMVMNIATGTGTLVHEMVHALIAVDFPDAPTWLNEGLGSLFEQCYVDNSSIYGLINWRFPALKKAVSNGPLVHLKDLIATSDAEFRGKKEALHYAEARYFCMYLQQKGLLSTFYRRFRDNCKESPSGEKFLVELLGKDLDAAEQDWLAWVKTLKRHE